MHHLTHSGHGETTFLPLRRFASRNNLVYTGDFTGLNIGASSGTSAEFTNRVDTGGFANEDPEDTFTPQQEGVYVAMLAIHLTFADVPTSGDLQASLFHSAFSNFADWLVPVRESVSWQFTIGNGGWFNNGDNIIAQFQNNTDQDVSIDGRLTFFKLF